ncbi:DUF4174 domain-containing protein [Lutimaribacter marinistellae]|uniref:DUF4174 domain-containing protein n=1 Tax=Lutimaribacter marinistellae TaxID=1820329 RepID=A0ABV7THZ0_9RHOB
MKRILALVFTCLFPVVASAADAIMAEDGPYIRPAGETDLSEFLWIKRPVIVFADTPADPRYQQQIQLLTERADEMIRRDVVVITDTDPAAKSPLRQKMRPRGFQLILMDKGGTIELRKPVPWDVRALSRSIDKMPLRQREIRESKGLE